MKITSRIIALGALPLLSFTLRAAESTGNAFYGDAPDEHHPWAVHDRNRPQPIRDIEAGAGMTVTVGRLRPDPVFDVKFTLLVHNTVRGAAGAALLNAELLLAQGRLAARTSAR